MKYLILLSFFLTVFLVSCNEKDHSMSGGKLFIIGGGNKTDSIMNELVELAGVRDRGYLFILPMASSVPDSAIIWTKEDFARTGIRKMTGYNFRKGETVPQPQLDSLRSAPLIFISGGDQSRFMDAVLNTKVRDAILEAYHKGAVISGTSAGAAVMSRKMITGNQLKHTGIEGSFPTIEAGNVEIKEGLGFLTGTIIDQHFIKRQRLNRLISVCIENPGEQCVGIDESTAIVVEGSQARVTGEGQVVVIRNKGVKNTNSRGLLGTSDLEITIYLPGDKFSIR